MAIPERTRRLVVDTFGWLFMFSILVGIASTAEKNNRLEVSPPSDQVKFAVSDQGSSNEYTSDEFHDRDIDRFLGISQSPQSFVTIASAILLQDQPELGPSPTSTPLASATTSLSSVFSASQASIVSQLSAARRADGTGPGSDFVLGLESSVLASTDAGNLVSKSNALLGVESEQRTPIVTYNVARGRHVGQQSGNGSYWFPARQDLDTLMSKIDSRIVDNFLIIKGPYSSVHGPGFAFYDVELLRAPRYRNGFESHGRTSMDFKANGGQTYGRQTFTGGASNWGYRIGYGERTGSDYRTGSLKMPTSYHSRDWDVALGYDISPYQHIDFTLLRLDQTDVEFPGQMFDMRYLVTDAYEIEYVNDCPSWANRTEIEGWYNRTHFAGDNLAGGKRRQIPVLDNLAVNIGFPTTGSLIGFTDVDAMSTGFSSAATWGCTHCGYIKLGTDLRRLKQDLLEQTAVTNIVGLPPDFTLPFPDNGLLGASYTNPGLFVEAGFPLTCCLTIKSGGRLDWVGTNSDPTFTATIENVVGQDLERDFFLYSGYVAAERRLNCHWMLDAGVGYGMRPPTMTELYADSPFIAVLPQLVFTQILGNPNLDPERMLQVDLGLNAEYCRFRGAVRGYHAWIEDYITYDLLNDIGFGTNYNPVNTPRATLFGAEAHGECEISCRWTGFATISYIEGTDQTRIDTIGPVRAANAPLTNRSGSTLNDETLPVIYPIVSRTGLRLHDTCPNPRWAVELAARIVNDQSRNALTLLELPTPGYTIFDMRAYMQATDNMLLTIGVENMFDRFYQEHFDPHVNLGTGGLANVGVFQPGVTFYTGIDWTY